MVEREQDLDTLNPAKTVYDWLRARVDTYLGQIPESAKEGIVVSFCFTNPNSDLGEPDEILVRSITDDHLHLELVNRPFDHHGYFTLDENGEVRKLNERSDFGDAFLQDTESVAGFLKDSTPRAIVTLERYEDHSIDI